MRNRVLRRVVGLSSTMLLAGAIVGCGVSTESDSTISVNAAAALVAHWPMDEQSGVEASDSTGSGHTGRLVGAAVFDGGGVTLDGTNGYVDVGAMDVSGNEVTVMARFLATDLSNCRSRDCRILSKATGVRTADHYMMVSTIAYGSQTRLRFRLKTNGSTSTLVASSGSVVENEWIHVSAVYNGKDMRLYQDGVLVGTRTKTGTITTNDVVSTWIGGNPPSATSRPWEGVIRDVRIYRRALSVDEIAAVIAPPSTNVSPVARINATTVEGEAPLRVGFNGATSSDSDGQVVGFSWDFGDGFTANQSSTEHTFSVPGTYTVSLVVTDDHGATGTTTKEITVTEHDHGSHDHDDLPHQDSPGKQREHLALFDLVRREDATHVAEQNGLWSQSSTWRNGVIPTDNSRVLIPESVSVTLGHQDSARLATVRVDGVLRFNPNADTQLNVDTLVVDVKGTLEIGTQSQPVRPDKTAKIVIIDRGPIDLAADPFMLGRGLISHGTVTMHGAGKSAFHSLAVPPARGATELVLDESPTAWRPRDVVVLTGVSPFENQDEVLQVGAVNGNRISVPALAFDHQVPEPDLKVYVANLTRNVVIESENKTVALQRGHVMFMHSRKVDIRYCAAVGTGRTDKSFAINEIELDSSGRLVPGTGNMRGRYALHFHRTGVAHDSPPAIAKGVVVTGSPGWGMVNHSSHLQASDNVSYNVVGAGFVGEVGNELGYYRHNIAIRSAGSGQHETDKRQFVHGSEHIGRNDDFGHGGHGFWMQGPLIELEDNVAAGHRHFGFVFWNRGLVEFDLDAPEDIARVGSTSGSIAKIPVANLLGSQPELTAGVEFVRSEDVMIRRFKNNTTFASGAGFEISRHMRGLSSRYDSAGWQSVIENFTAWNVGNYRDKYGHGPIGSFESQSGDNGISVRYSTRVVLKNPRLLGIDDRLSTGINHNHFADRNMIINAIIKRFDRAIRNEGVFEIQ